MNNSNNTKDFINAKNLANQKNLNNTNNFDNTNILKNADNFNNQKNPQNEKNSNINNKKKSLLPLTNDYVFKRSFGYGGCEESTKSLLSAIIGQSVGIIDLDKNPITEKDVNEDKIGIMDIKAELDGRRALQY